MGELLLRLTSVELPFSDGINNLTVELEAGSFYHFKNFTQAQMELLDLYLRGRITKKLGSSFVPHRFSYQSDLQWFNHERQIESLEKWLALRIEPIDSRLNLTKLKVLDELGLSAEIYSRPSRLSSQQLQAFIISSFLFQSKGVILCAKLDFNQLTSKCQEYLQLFVEKTNCAVLFCDNIPISLIDNCQSIENNSGS